MLNGCLKITVKVFENNSEQNGFIISSCAKRARSAGTTRGSQRAANLQRLFLYISDGVHHDVIQ